ncbi:hypothetical protein G4X40_10405 [Rhodococcus sp. D2-41]|uniref:DUF8020 domain-containing protein n=1 Tax=Speluncibacter jeojiensis TaxID=2710754 RepID=A0A9X4M0X2_9ACTN|nr:hypothetical protein [Rhodococcus sp. D2-41]MDG3010559.1 hypothetical protein [Rhodococcus sp. D2-41]MDG3014307.1 hypothetical protein [Corynebacteriales bacterium D3-21]
MKIRKFATTSVLLVAAMGAAAGTANAAPSPAAAKDAANVLHWNLARQGDHVVLRTDSGSLTSEDGHLVVRNAAGNAAAAVPLAYAVISEPGKVFPVAARIDDDTATLTPSRTADAGLSAKVPGLHPADLNSAVAAVKDPIGLTSQIGGFVGAAAGIVGGCVLGAAAAGVVSAPAVELLGAGPLAGCVGGALLLGTTAGLAGTAIGGLGGVAANAQPFLQKLNEPAKPAK